jgi:acyl-CoA synthetase (AMP-forming)/AMP-acid ligase II
MAVVQLHPDRLAEPDETVAKDNESVGEVIVKSPAKCAYTYINKPEEAEKKFYKGWLYIGDLATWNEQEFVTIVGRKDDMIISGGENVHPVQVEEVLNEHPGVSGCVVVGIPDKKWGEIVTAYVIKGNASLTAKDLDEHCLNHPMLSKYKRPRLYKLVDELPMTATGKLIHYKVRKWGQEDYEKGNLEKV